MQYGWWLLAASTTPTPVEGTVDPNLVTPGPWGFAVIALVGVAVALLVWDMLRRIRRGRYRAEVREMLDAEELSAEQGAAATRDSDTDDQDIDPADDPRR
ncbi:hypothetical protein F6J84_05215 [Microbacterium caowuchunii]|jgi:hypothetical protein|uniref:hypothetical protein n=1 Tax=Microbacterium caowuchunii TaxID=2614638 RepID=UPI001245439B|nr:hypothetical protein [Microbacterium caowuchunii]QEV99558.1 hypothetical protein F6J84_05215 [Microbacterium caowuchunii]